VVDKKLEDYTLEDMQQIVGVNEIGVYLCTKEVVSKMTSGTVVNVSSTAAFAGSFDSIYAATKGAVHSFTKSMAVELAPRIRVNCVAPGLTKTDMGLTGWKPEELEARTKGVPLGDIAEPQDVASGIYFLASDEARHITGACLDINGGYVLR
jgi:3-oxoacyl-[acyl-carrier protein] reductase